MTTKEMTEERLAELHKSRDIVRQGQREGWAHRFHPISFDVADAVDDNDRLRAELAARTAEVEGLKVTTAIWEAITAERGRQERLKVEKGWEWTMATPGIDHALKLMPILEEAGEVARAVRIGRFVTSESGGHENHGLYAELVQVAACAVGWLEALAAEAALNPEPAS